MGKEIIVTSLEEMCDLMCDNIIPEKKPQMTRNEAKKIIEKHTFLFASMPDEVLEAIDALEQDQTGHWVETDDETSPYCSECHAITYKWPYCPICGSYNEGVKKEYFDEYAEIARAIEIDAIPRKILKHRLYERYIDNPTEFKELAALLDDIMHVMKYNAEAYDNSQKM